MATLPAKGIDIAMNIFVLSTGRCGSMSFYKACLHISNYTAGHESRLTCIGEERLTYPQNHIESDNRLSWILGRLDAAYGDNAFYVHLTRDRQQVAQSYARRSDFGIMKAFRDGILLGGKPEQSELDIALEIIDTVEMNIQLFLRDKTRVMTFRLESAKQDFNTFWDRTGAQGDLSAALAEWDVHHNAS